MYKELLKDVYDLHVHTEPDVMPRKLDDIEMAERIQKIGMKGYAIKSHYFCTAERAKFINKLYPNVNVIGAICLNNSVGGLNPIAVEMAARNGAKIVWMPTLDATNEQEYFEKKMYETKKLPYWAKLKLELNKQGKLTTSISIMEGGILRNSILDILDIIAQYKMVLMTGHLGKVEVFSLVKAAVERDVKKIVITHPTFPSANYTKEEQKELARQGAYMEHCFRIVETGKTSWEKTYEHIQYVGPQNCILSTDLGQPDGPYPEEGFGLFVSNLLKNGFSKEDIKKMTVNNPELLVKD